MSNAWEIAGSSITFVGAVWLSIDAFLIRSRIRSESAAAELLKVLKSLGAGDTLTDKDGKPLNTEKALQLWFAQRSITWNWIALSLVTLGFLLDLIGKIKG